MGEPGLACPTGEDAVKRMLSTRWLAVVLRIALGIIFIISAWPKLSDPPAFAQMVSNYRLIPEVLISPAALVLPWLEMLAGLALITGWGRRGAAVWIAFLLIVFMGALSINLARGVAVDCGCFSVTASRKSHEEMISAMKSDLVRDSVMLLMALFTLVTPVTWRSVPPRRMV